jgi:hypothetical protein
MAVTVTVLLRPGVQPGGGAVGSDRSGVSASGPAVGVSSPAPASDAFVYTQSRVIEWSDPWRQTASGKTVKQVPKRRATVRETWISVDGSRAGGEGADGSLNLDFTGCKNAAVGSPVCRPDPGYQANFPTTVDAIRRTLHRDYPDTRKDDGEGVFDAIGEVMLERLVPSASRAALFQLALTSPGVVRVAGTSTIDGVSGVLLTRKSRLHQEELLFDGQTDELIGRATVPLLPSGQAGPLSSVGAYVQVVVDRGVVTKFGVRPAGTTVPSKK